MPAGIFEAYLAGRAAAFFSAHFGSRNDRLRAVERAARPLGGDVAGALETQNARLPPSAARSAHLATLRSGAAAVVTGQQMGLFLGPLFTIYKAATAIRAARALSAESGRPVVPVFWLQDEDHDLPEIAIAHVPCAEGPLTLRVPASPADRVSVAHCTLTDDVTTCLAMLGVQLAHLPHAAAHLDRLAQHYVPGRSWSEAFAGVLTGLFDDLVFLDPRDPAIAAAAVPVHRRAILDAQPIADHLVARSRRLEDAGFAPTVHVRPGAPLSFFHPDGARGPRYRLTPADDDYALIGHDGRYTRDELLGVLAVEPLRFSTSALLRPILQDTLLPTAAYVGGPAEVAYFAQLAPLYAAYDLAMPLIVPRVRLRVVDRRTARLLARLGLSPEEACRADAERLAAARIDSADAAALDHRVRAPFTEALDAVRAEMEPLPPGVGVAFEKTRSTVEAALAKLGGKIEVARLHASQETATAARYVRDMLWPRGTPQERLYGLAYFAACHGERAFLDRVVAAAEPFDARVRDLVLADEALA